MERLTARSENNKAYLKKVNKNEQEIDGSCNTLKAILESFDKLAEYEDTGLTPQEIKDHEEMFKAYRNVCGGYSPEQIEKYIEIGKKFECGELVEVVRCKDCIKRYTPDCLMQYECSICKGQWSWETDNGYCSYGERSVD